MEMYFQENLHLLANGSQENAPVATPRSDSLDIDHTHSNATNQIATNNLQILNGVHARMPLLTSDKLPSDDDSDEGGVYVLPDDILAPTNSTSEYSSLQFNSNNNARDSFDEQGDFIEADIARNSNASTSSSDTSRKDSSTTSSYEDLIGRTASLYNGESIKRADNEETFTKLVFDKPNSSLQKSSTNNVPRHCNRPSVPARYDAQYTPAPPCNVVRPSTLVYENYPRHERGLRSPSPSPLTFSSLAFTSPSCSDNSGTNAPTSGSSLFPTPDAEFNNAPVDVTSQLTQRFNGDHHYRDAKPHCSFYQPISRAQKAQGLCASIKIVF